MISTKEFVGLEIDKVENAELKNLISARIPLFGGKLVVVRNKISIEYDGKTVISITIGNKTLKPGMSSLGQGMYIGNFGKESMVNFYKMNGIVLDPNDERVIISQDKANELIAFIRGFDKDAGGNLGIKDPKERGYSCGDEDQIIVAFYFEGLVQKIQKLFASR